MLRILFASFFGLAVFASPAFAACPSFTYALTNGTTADATQVMANFNVVRDCVNAFDSGATFGAPTFTGLTKVYDSSSTGYSTFRLYNDQNVATRSLELDYSGSAYSGSFLSGSPTGEAGFLTTTGAYPLVFGTSNATRMTITSSGNVGIGTNAPATPLHIYSAVATIATFARSSSNNAALEAVNSSGAVYFGRSATAAIDFAIANTANLSSSPYLAINTSGNVGIGTNTPAYPLDVNGGIHSTGRVGIATAVPTAPLSLDVVGDIQTSGCLHYNNSTLGTCVSDAIIKSNIAPYTNFGLAQIAALTPVTFYYNGLAGMTKNGIQQLGLIAQDVEKVAPQLIGSASVKLRATDRASTKIKTVNYSALTFGLINAVKELKAVNDRNALKIDALEREVAALKRGRGVRLASERY